MFDLLKLIIWLSITLIDVPYLKLPEGKRFALTIFALNFILVMLMDHWMSHGKQPVLIINVFGKRVSGRECLAM